MNAQRLKGERRHNVLPLQFPLILALLVLLFQISPAVRTGPSPGSGNEAGSAALFDYAPRPQMVSAAGSLDIPVFFVANRGQVDDTVAYYAHGGGANVAFTTAGPVLRLGDAALRIRFAGARAVQPVGAGELPTRVNYFIGRDPAKWQTNLPTYDEVVYPSLYPGIDLHYREQDGALKYAFTLQPGAAPSQIRLILEGAESLRLDENGNLLLGIGGRLLRDTAPLAYQKIGNRWESVQVAYTLLGTHTVGFEVRGEYDPRFPLTIDPLLKYSTFLGGNSADQINAIAMDADGYVYVTGVTTSANFPVTPGALDGTPDRYGDAFVVKLDPGQSGTASLVYATFLGGAYEDVGKAIAVDAGGDVYVQGETTSDDFPTHNPYQGQWSGGQDAFLVRISAAGDALRYATFLGGSSTEYLYDALAVDESGEATMAGYTLSTDFPTTPGVFQTSFAGGDTDVFVTRLDTTKSGTDSMVFSTYLGGSGKDFGMGVAVDEAGSAYVVGDTKSDDFPTQNPYQSELGGTIDAFVTKLNPTASALVYSTYLGGSNNLIYDRGWGIAVDSAGRAVVTGDTKSSDFPTTPGAFQTTLAGSFDTFVTQFNAAGDSLVFSTLFGGSKEDYGHDVAMDEAGIVYVAGHTSSEDLPTCLPTQPNQAGGVDAFVMQLGPAGDRLLFATYLGGSDAYWYENDYWDVASDIAVNKDGTVAVGGYVQSEDFPTTANAYQPSYAGGDYDAFVTIFDMSARPDLSPSIKRVSPTQAAVGEVVTFTVSLINQGKLSTTVSLTDTLPVALLLQGNPTASAGNPPTVDGQTITWNGMVDDGAVVTITSAAMLTSTTTLTPTVVNTAYIADESCVVHLRSAFVNGYSSFLPLILRQVGP